MIRYTCRLCGQFIRDPEWCDACKDNQYKVSGNPRITPEKEAELEAFVKSIGDTVKKQRSAATPESLLEQIGNIAEHFERKRA